MAGKPIARCFADKFECPKHPPTVTLLPATMPVTRLVDGYFVVRLGDFGLCMGVLDVVVEGSDSMFACGLPIARKGDAMMHGGTITTGSPTEEDGGGTLRLPRNVAIHGDPLFASKVVRDLYFLSTKPNGQATFKTIAGNGEPVVIKPGDDNVTEPDDMDAVRTGRKTGSTIYYNPDKLNVYAVTQSGCLPCPPQLNLGHELIHAARFGSSGRATLQPLVEEKGVIGPPFGGPGYTPKGWPTENGLRKDLKLPLRLNYDKCDGHAAEADNLRPGQCKV
jgi:uncharacterized Zn-binding protein involved in type VI secretion